MSDDKISRRKIIKNTSKISLMIYGGGKAPFMFAKKKPVLRVLGTHVTLQEELRRQAMKDLNIELVFEPKGSAAVLHKAASNPGSFDLYEQWSDSINILWQAKAIQGIEVERLKYWNEINQLSKTGKIVPEAKIGKGDSPHKILYVQKDKTLGTSQSNLISFLPYVHNVDSFGYNRLFAKP